MTEMSIFPTALVWSILALPLLHYIADFELQTNWMAINKSKNLNALMIHVLIYSAIFAAVFGPVFGLITLLLHFFTDLVTSRWSRNKFPFVPNPERPKVLFDRDGQGKRSRHRFFCVIGFDQMVHAYSLVATAVWLNAKPWWM